MFTGNPDLPGLCWALGTHREIRAGLCSGRVHSEAETDRMQSTVSATVAGV